MINSSINPEQWKVNLPIYPPTGVLDNSTISEYSNCPTKGFYRYGLRRGFDGKSWAIQYGLAYHNYREHVEKLMISGPKLMNDHVHELAKKIAFEGWEDPPFEHKHAHLNSFRLEAAIELARSRIEEEQRTGRIIVTRAEDSFDLELPFVLCKKCAWTNIDLEAESCPTCGCEHLYRPRHGGRVDQFIKFSSLQSDMVRDFKTTGFKGRTYEDKFDPNGQVQGYTWAGTALSGRQFDGALIETVYNTKTRGPEISQHYVTYSAGQIERWQASMMMEWQTIMTMFSRVEELGYLAFPQRTGSCSNFGGCPFREACRSGSSFEIEEWLENYTIHSHWDFTEPSKEEAKK